MNKKTLGISLGAVALLSLSAVLLFPKGTSLASADKVQTTSSNQVKKTAPTGKEKTAQKILKEFPTLEAAEKYFLVSEYDRAHTIDDTVFIPDANQGEQAGWSTFYDGKADGKPITDAYGDDTKTGKKFLMYRASDAITYKEIKALYNK